MEYIPAIACKIIASSFDKQFAVSPGTPNTSAEEELYPGSRARTPPQPSSRADPSNPVEGNDDSEVVATTLGPLGENSNPYDNAPAAYLKGHLYDHDAPSHPNAMNAGPPNGASIEVKLQFRAFCRLEIKDKWYRISDFALWRAYGKLTKNPHDRNGDTIVAQDDSIRDGCRRNKQWLVTVMRAFVTLILLTHGVGFSQTPNQDIVALAQHFETLAPREQQLEILKRLPHAVGDRETFDWLASSLALDTLGDDDIASLVRGLLHVAKISSETPGAVVPNSRRGDFSPPGALLYRIRQLLVNDMPGIQVSQDQGVSKANTTRNVRRVACHDRVGTMNGTVAPEAALPKESLYTMMALGRENRTPEKVLLAAEEAINAFEREYPHWTVRTALGSGHAPFTAPLPATGRASTPVAPPPVRDIEHGPAVWPWLIAAAVLIGLEIVVLRRRRA